MTDTDRDLAVIADYMRRRGAVPLPAGLMAAARERALRQAPERDTARASLAAFWTRGPAAMAGALGALATVAVLLGVLSGLPLGGSGLPLGGTDAPAADPSLDGHPSSSPAASTSSTVVCGQVEADACQTAIALVRDGHPGEVADASAIVVDDTCPPYATCFREYPFEVAVVLVPSEGVLRDVVAFRIFGAAGPEQAATWAGALPRHVIRLIPGAPVPSVVEPSPSPEGQRLADPIVISNSTDRPVTLLIDGAEAVEVEAGSVISVSTQEVPLLPFRVEARFASGRVIGSREGPDARPFLMRIGSTCGVLDVWSAPTQHMVRGRIRPTTSTATRTRSLSPSRPRLLCRLGLPLIAQRPSSRGPWWRTNGGEWRSRAPTMFGARSCGRTGTPPVARQAGSSSTTRAGRSWRVRVTSCRSVAARPAVTVRGWPVGTSRRWTVGTSRYCEVCGRRALMRT